MPKLSIIVPVYKVEAYLERCINSILHQSFQDFELILVDDGSPDGCPDICDHYAKQDRRITVIHRINGGLAAARNSGLELVTGDYISFVDSDDWIHKDMYKVMLNRAIQYDADITVCGFENLNQYGEKVINWQNIDKQTAYARDELLDDFYPHLFNDIRGSVCNKLYKRYIFSNIRFKEGMIYEDSYILMDTLLTAKKVLVIPERFYMYFATRNDSIMHYKYSSKMFASLDVVKKNYDIFKIRTCQRQRAYALENYLNDYLRHYLAVKLRYREFNDDLKMYQKDFPVFEVLECNGICKMKKITLLLSLLCPKVGWIFCCKYFPECMFEFMNIKY